MQQYGILANSSLSDTCSIVKTTHLGCGVRSFQPFAPLLAIEACMQHRHAGSVWHTLAVRSMLLQLWLALAPLWQFWAANELSFLDSGPRRILMLQ